MGCATSKPKVCHKCRAPCSPVRRSYSMQDDVSYHMVALTSSTLGSLKLDPLNHSQSIKDDGSSSFEHVDFDEVRSCKEEFAMGLIEAKTWSEMINEKIPKVVPKTPIRTPPGEPETINTWELMEGLEDCSPLKPVHHVRSFSFHVSPNPDSSQYDLPTPRVKDDIEGSPKPLWEEVAEDETNSSSNDTSIVSEFDPEVISTFRKALEDLPPENPFHLKPLTDESHQPAADNEDTLEITDAKKVTEYKVSKDKIVVYFTSLRGVRKTYEDCCHVRVILKGLGVKIDERDVSMHSGFKEELKELLGNEYSGGGLPRIFLGKKYIGGADEIRRMNEDGKLEKFVENCEKVEDGVVLGSCNCEACGDIRFVPCETCSGSCKIYYEADYEEEQEEIEDDEYGFQRCPDCNENGLIRCPICCD
ncbi:hypothetical protein FXO38_24578 [Capsicum annuum]|uniref:Glutaredoxin domain-containing protein n=1 Tax=Capsicum annuum TaxID=4072 RepID=A0A1U8FYA2_CAPAN|nr:uncharacterized protein At3g28850 [Capsicum annuum]KAF3635568.1 hypothetical protein FXO38_24578 [Capsicum annuum]KAF3682374.1 hypothetical protein FXO37_02366 [Capsicum annuum]PHT91863.1 hypothetical protein T459_06976 [Capsicum annuum]